MNKFDLDSDGIDRHMGVNVFGHVLLINRLLPLMRSTTSGSPPRIVMLSSELHRTAPGTTKFASIKEVYTNDEELGPNQLYSRSKLAVL